MSISCSHEVVYFPYEIIALLFIKESWYCVLHPLLVKSLSVQHHFPILSIYTSPLLNLKIKNVPPKSHLVTLISFCNTHGCNLGESELILLAANDVSACEAGWMIWHTCMIPLNYALKSVSTSCFRHNDTLIVSGGTLVSNLPRAELQQNTAAVLTAGLSFTLPMLLLCGRLRVVKTSFTIELLVTIYHFFISGGNLRHGELRGTNCCKQRYRSFSEAVDGSDIHLFIV
jgi:hypothetical protein